MRTVRTISLIARVALMATMVLGLLFWIAQIGFLSMRLTILVQIGLTIRFQLGTFLPHLPASQMMDATMNHWDAENRYILAFTYLEDLSRDL